MTTELPDDEYAALAPAALLRDLAASRPAGEVPIVSVYLAGGHRFRGGLVKVATDRGHDVAVLTMTTDPRGGVDEVVYLLVRDVLAVAVQSAVRKVAAVPTNTVPTGSPAQAGAGDPASGSRLRREFLRSDDFPLDVDLARLPETPTALVNLRRILVALREAVATLQCDEAGRQAFAAVSTIAVEQYSGETLNLVLAVGRLTVRVDLTAALPPTLDTHIEDQLAAAL